TAGGLLFIGASNFDKKFRAYDSATGKLLWETTLPFSGNATPATYSVKGRQYVVIAAGGGKDLRSKSGGVYVAFVLPNPQSARLSSPLRAASPPPRKDPGGACCGAFGPLPRPPQYRLPRPRCPM